MIADPQGQILDSKEFLSPIITPYEAMLAFSSDSQWDASQYRLDFDEVVSSSLPQVLLAVARTQGAHMLVVTMKVLFVLQMP